MTQPPFGPPPGGPERSDDPSLPPPIPPGPGVGSAPGAAPPPPPGAPAPGGGTPPGYAGAPTSPAPQWQQLPPEQLARMHQPGIVPLRPLTLGDMFGGALQTMRRNPEATIGSGLIVLAVMLVPSLLLSLLAVRALATTPELDVAVVTAVISMLLTTLASMTLTGMIVHVVGEAVLGDRASLSSTWRAVKGRLPALLGTIVLLAVIFVVGLVALGVALVLLGMAAEALVGTGAMVAIMVLGAIGGIVVMVWAASRLALASAPVVLERIGPIRAISRAWRLTSGAQAWRVVGITILAGILTSIFTALVQLPVYAVLVSVTGLDALDTSAAHTGTLVADHAIQLVVGALTIPFTAGVSALLYLDQRIRREGLDITLVQAAQARAAARGR